MKNSLCCDAMRCAMQVRLLFMFKFVVCHIFPFFFSFVSYRITCILTVQHKAKHVISSVDSGDEYGIGSTGKEIRFKSVVISSHDEVVNR